MAVGAVHSELSGGLTVWTSKAALLTELVVVNDFRDEWVCGACHMMCTVVLL